MTKHNLFLVLAFGLFSINSCTTLEPIKVSDKNLAPVEVKILKYKFIPQTIEIKVGQTIQWINVEKRQYHSVWFEQQGEEESEYMFPGDKLEKQFIKPGRYPYRCGPHPEMVGVIIVI